MVMLKKSRFSIKAGLMFWSGYISFSWDEFSGF